MSGQYDAVFIGGGHNALVAAAYLARGGFRVVVLDRNDRPGGFVRTDELTLPGFVHDTYSTAHPFFVNGPVYAELGTELAARGLQYVNADFAAGVSMPGGRTAVLSRDASANVAELNRLSPSDGAAFSQLLGEVAPHAGAIFSLFNMDLTTPEAKRLIRQLMLAPEGEGLNPFVADLLIPARDLLETRFKSEVLHGLIAPWLLHMARGPEDAHSGIWLAFTLMSLQAGGAPTPVGGSEMLVKALVRLIQDHQGEVLSNSHVDRILVEQGSAAGAVTSDGRVFRARRAVVASTNPDQLYLKLLQGTGVVSPEVQRQASRFRYGLGAVQIHLALSAPPDFPDERLRKTLLTHLTTGLNGVSRALNDAACGLLPADPTISFDIPTAVDPARAPPGKAIARVQIPGVPRRARGDAAGAIDVGDGRWTDDLKNRFADRVIDIATKHIPNLKGSILGRHVIGPADLARFNPNAGDGDPYAGAHDLAQSYLLQPIAAQPSHRTPVPKLYMVGAATWPGHGVSGGSGYIVAKELLAGRPA